MTVDQIKTFAHEAVVQHPPREVYVRVLDQDHPPIIGEVHYAGNNKVRIDTPQAALFIPYDEIEAIEYTGAS